MILADHEKILKLLQKFWPECNMFEVHMRSEVKFSHKTGEPLQTYYGEIEISHFKKTGEGMRLRLECLTGKTFANPEEKICTKISDLTHSQTIFIEGVGFFYLKSLSDYL